MLSDRKSGAALMSQNIPDLVDRGNSLTCKMLPGAGPARIIEWLRAFVKSKYVESGYAGFSEEYDRQFDEFSVYLYVVDADNKLQAVQRVIHKTPDNLLPLEKALVCGSQNDRCVVDEQDVVEITSFVFRQVRAIDLLTAAAAHYGLVNNVKKAYALLNRDSKTLRRLYEKIGWEKSRAHSALVFFSGYGKMAQGYLVPAVWQVMRMPEVKIKMLAGNIGKYGPAYQ
jgi:hypothetical protein